MMNGKLSTNDLNIFKRDIDDLENTLNELSKVNLARSNPDSSGKAYLNDRNIKGLHTEETEAILETLLQSKKREVRRVLKTIEDRYGITFSNSCGFN